MANRLRHAYGRIDFTIIWTVMADDLPGLKADAAAALERVDNADSLTPDR